MPKGSTATINFDKLVKLVKGGATQSKAADALGVTVGQLGMMKFCQAQVAAGVYSKAPATGPSVKKLRDNEGNRWELIAARIGSTVGNVKNLYEDAGGDLSKTYVGRGQKPTNGKASSGTKASSGRKTSGKAQAGKKGSVPRARTRAERAARGNPS
jgi:hypothetical protein